MFPSNHSVTAPPSSQHAGHQPRPLRPVTAPTPLGYVHLDPHPELPPCPSHQGALLLVPARGLSALSSVPSDPLSSQQPEGSSTRPRVVPVTPTGSPSLWIELQALSLAPRPSRTGRRACLAAALLQHATSTELSDGHLRALAHAVHLAWEAFVLLCHLATLPITQDSTQNLEGTSSGKPRLPPRRMSHP